MAEEGGVRRSRFPGLLLAGGLVAACLLSAAALVWARRGGGGGETPTNGNGPQQPSSTPPVETPKDADGIIAKLREAQLGNKDRQKALQALAGKGEGAALEALIKLADDREYAMYALEAMAWVRTAAGKAAVEAALKRRFGSSRPAEAEASVRSYAKVFGDAAVPEVVGYIQLRWQMHDGYEVQAASAGAEALGAVGTPAAVAALAGELARAGEPAWMPDYGSAVVAALAKSRSEEARSALLGYAQALRARMPGPDNPPGRAYYEEKIAEAEGAAARAGGPPAPDGGVPPPPPLPPE